ncbi:hypothetical protein B7486_04190 [cyanobacterium TDX16]|nr:hypothetical protein B7486_04190 [cyanobacterium TDX16]
MKTKTAIVIKHCPTCGSPKIRKTTKDVVSEFDGQKYKVPRLEFYECPACGERIYGPEAMRKIESASPAFKRTRSRRRTG